VPDAKVELIKEGEVIDEDITDEYGNYTLTPGGLNAYTINASKGGYCINVSQDVTVTEYETVVNFEYDTGLIPYPDFDYVLDCIYLWKTEMISFDKMLDVTYCWKKT